MRISQVLFFLLCIGMFSCTKSPGKLAKEYCSCLHEMENGSKKEGECAELAESHVLQLNDDEKALKEYTNNIMDCIGFRKIKTSK